MSDYLVLFVIKNARIARLELFEVDAIDTALARFEELSQAVG